VLGLQTLLQTTRSVSIVFNSINDPGGSGFIDSLARPGGNATGFVLFDYTLTAKWVELLKQIAPTVTRVAVIRDPGLTAGIGQFAVIQYVAKLPSASFPRRNSRFPPASATRTGRSGL